MKKTIAGILASLLLTSIFALVILSVNRIAERENMLSKIIDWPDLAAQTLDGAETSTRQLASGSPVLFNYFSTQCPFCKNKFDDILRHTDLQDSATMIFVSDETAETIDRFRIRSGLEENRNFIFLLDSNGSIREHYGIRSVPMTYLYDGEGKLIGMYRGETRAEILYSQLKNSGQDKDG